ncbi:MAG: response regulator [Alphaproteobacteria bacterium]|nr:response regulator [Alphaproteobacteria bacterium]
MTYNLSNLNMLVVDDNKHMRDMVSGVLRALGVKTIVEAANGQDAFNELKTFSADIIICDWHMEPMDGMAFLHMVRTHADSSNPYIPFIMLTGHTELNRVLTARDTGVHEFLTKPISVKKLYDRIRTVIERPRAFIKTGAYFGPDRRRRQDPNYNGEERRASDILDMEAMGLTSEQVDELLMA